MSNTKQTSLESRIVQLLAQGDKQAVSLIYDNYSSALYGVIARIVKTPENAEEVLQDVLVKVWTKSASYDASKGRLYTWLLNIARNSSIDFTRSAKYKVDKKTNEFDINVYNNNSAFSANEQPQDSGLLKVIDGLDEKYRKIIDLVYFNQYTQSEIVQELNLPLGTVKSRIRIALRELRTVLGDEFKIILILISILLLL